MKQKEKEIKILNINVNEIKSILDKKKIKPKWGYIQDIYTFDLPNVSVIYKDAIDRLKSSGDKRLLKKILSEIESCFSKENISIIKEIIGKNSISEYIETETNYNLLLDERITKVVKSMDNRYSKWVRLRQTGNETTITIKKIIDGKAEYNINNVEELEFSVPNIEFGKEFLSDFGYFFDRHQIKMRIAYDYKKTEIVIDKWPLLEPYIEIEGPTINDIMEAVELIGYKKEDIVVMNTDALYYQKNIDIYSEEYKDLSFSKKEKKEIEEYLNL